MCQSVSAEEHSPGMQALDRGSRTVLFNSQEHHLVIKATNWSAVVQRDSSGGGAGGEASYGKTELRSGSWFPCVNINTTVLVCPVITCLGVTISLELIDTASPC